MFNDTNIKIPMRYRFGLEGVYEENGIYWAYTKAGSYFEATGSHTASGRTPEYILAEIKTMIECRCDNCEEILKIEERISYADVLSKHYADVLPNDSFEAYVKDAEEDAEWIMYEHVISDKHNLTTGKQKLHYFYNSWDQMIEAFENKELRVVTNEDKELYLIIETALEKINSK